MKAVFRILMTTLTLALALPLLSATVACNDCEDFCEQQYDECAAGSTIDDAHCRAERSECLSGCDAEPSGWDRFGDS